MILSEIESLLASTEYDTLLIFAPPGSGKSYYVSVVLPSFFLAANPEASILAASHNVTLAEKWGRRVRNLVSDHSRVLGLDLAPDNQAAGRWATTRGGEYLAAGVGVGIAGFRADLGIVDDPFGSRQDAFSERIRDTTWDWFVNDFSSRLKPGAKRVIMHTRWHTDDMAGRIIERAEHGAYKIKVLSLPAIADANDPLGRKPGEYLWDEPDGYDYGAFLRARRAEVDPLEWSSLYQQAPSPDAGDYFKNEWFRWYGEQPKGLRLYGASDYAVTARGGDYTVHMVAGVDSADNIYIVDLWRGQTESHEWVEAFIDMVDEYKPLIWAEEQGQIVKSLGPFIDKRMRERQVFCRREQMVSVADKPTRSRSIQARASMGKVYLPTGAPWLPDLMSELMAFPAGKHDDQVDTLGLIGRLIDQMVSKRGPSSGNGPKPDRWRQAFRKKSGPNQDWKTQ